MYLQNYLLSNETLTWFFLWKMKANLHICSPWKQSNQSSISSTWENSSFFSLFCSQNPLNFQTDARFWSCYVKNKELETFLSCLHIFSIAKWLLMLVFCKLSRALSHFTYFSSSSCPKTTQLLHINITIICLCHKMKS